MTRTAGLCDAHLNRRGLETLQPGSGFEHQKRMGGGNELPEIRHDFS